MLQGHDMSFAFSEFEEQSLFEKISFQIDNERVGLVGNNGSGKSTLLKILFGELLPTKGYVQATSRLHLLSQLSDLSVSHRLWTIARALELNHMLPDDWEYIENRWDELAQLQKALSVWGCDNLLQQRDLSDLNPGAIQRLNLALIFRHSKDFLLLDEPSNHLDRKGRDLLNEAIAFHEGGLLIASHDRKLLESVDKIWELKNGQLNVYGGSYSLYHEQKFIEETSRRVHWETTRKELKKAQNEAQNTLQRQEKRSREASKNKDKLGLPKILLGARKRAAEGTAARLKKQLNEKVERLKEDTDDAASSYFKEAGLKVDLKGSSSGGEKVLLDGKGLNIAWGERPLLWKDDLYFSVRSEERWAIAGDNGSGKSTLMKMILKVIEPTKGKINIFAKNVLMLDQSLTVLPFDSTLSKEWEKGEFKDEPERRTIAARLGLGPEELALEFQVMSGGERMRAALVLLATRKIVPDLLLLDEPTNHLDIETLQSLTSTLLSLRCALVIVSHDSSFLGDIQLTGTLHLT